MRVELHQQPMTECVYLRIHCKSCGPVRLAITQEELDKGSEVLENLNIDTICPICRQKAKYEIIGKGQTTRQLPHHQLEIELERAFQDTKWLHPNGKHRMLREGSKVVYFPEPNVLYQAEVTEVWTNAAHVSPTGMPGLRFRIGPEHVSDIIPHVSKTAETPFWMHAEELSDWIKKRRLDHKAEPAKPPKKKKSLRRRIADRITGKK